jgi:hypothetical protein
LNEDQKNDKVQMMELRQRVRNQIHSASVYHPHQYNDTIWGCIYVLRDDIREMCNDNNTKFMTEVLDETIRKQAEEAIVVARQSLIQDQDSSSHVIAPVSELKLATSPITPAPAPAPSPSQAPVPEQQQHQQWNSSLFASWPINLLEQQQQ